MSINIIFCISYSNSLIYDTIIIIHGLNVGSTFLLQTVVRVLLKDVFIPYVNTRLNKGFSLPVIHGFTMTNSEIWFGDSSAVICTDLAPAPSNWTSAKTISSLIKQ